VVVAVGFAANRRAVALEVAPAVTQASASGQTSLVALQVPQMCNVRARGVVVNEHVPGVNKVGNGPLPLHNRPPAVGVETEIARSREVDQRTRRGGQVAATNGRALVRARLARVSFSVCARAGGGGYRTVALRPHFSQSCARVVGLAVGDVEALAWLTARTTTSRRRTRRAIFVAPKRTSFEREDKNNPH
jgi:hypothetical protein